MLKYALLLYVLIGAVSVCAEPKTATRSYFLDRQIETGDFVEGNFVQSRYLSGFSRPLLSSGVFYFWRDHGLYWEMQKPFFSAITYGRNGAINWTEKGVVESFKKNDALQKQINLVVMATLAADVDLLSLQFKVALEENEQGWIMELHPKKAMVAQLIKYIELSGDRHLHKTTLVAANGDKTVIEFDAAETSAKPPFNQCQRFYAEPGLECAGDG